MKWRREEVPYDFRVLDNGNETESPSDQSPEELDQLPSYSCPECGDTVACNRDDAVRLFGFIPVNTN